MRFGVQAWGSEGDVRPLIGLAAALRTAGHDVSMTICSDPRVDYEALCAAHGVTYVDAGTHLDFVATGAVLPRLMDAAWFRAWHRAFFVDSGNDELMYDAALALCADSDVVIGHYLSYPTKAATLETGTPHVSVQLTPDHTPTGHRPSRPGLPDLGRRLNLLSWQEAFRLQDGFFKGDYMRFWTGKGLPPFDHLWSLYVSEELNLLAVSPLLFPPEPDWGTLHVVTGFLDLPAAGPAAALPESVEAFLAEGEPPVFMTFGSGQEVYPDADPDANAGLFLEAALRTGRRTVIQVGEEAAAAYPPHTRSLRSDAILFVDWIPYGAIFARSALAVHHAGAGTCQLALRHGCPSVTLPPTPHHATFGDALHRVGAAPAPVARGRVSPNRLGTLVERVLADPAYAERAAAAGRALGEEDGVRRAVEAIHERFGTVGSAAGGSAGA